MLYEVITIDEPILVARRPSVADQVPAKNPEAVFADLQRILDRDRVALDGQVNLAGRIDEFTLTAQRTGGKEHRFDRDADGKCAFGMRIRYPHQDWQQQ